MEGFLLLNLKAGGDPWSRRFSGMIRLWLARLSSRWSQAQWRKTAPGSRTTAMHACPVYCHLHRPLTLRRRRKTAMQVYVQVIGFACKIHDGLRARVHSSIMASDRNSLRRIISSQTQPGCLVTGGGALIKRVWSEEEDQIFFTVSRVSQLSFAKGYWLYTSDGVMTGFCACQETQTSYRHF